MKIFSFVLLVALGGQVLAQTDFYSPNKSQDSLLTLRSIKISDSLAIKLYSNVASHGQFDKRNRKTGPWTEYNLNIDSIKEAVSVKTDYFEYKIQIPRMIILEKYSGHYKRGQPTGEWQFFIAHFNLRGELDWFLNRTEHFKKGEKHGKHTHYDMRGVTSVTHFHKGKLIGKIN